ncbi:MAG: hypothetical protein QOI12_2772 [Alphaproteobacteria bacterium]|nr:hypothetical protein [Alphaproteobacteria bacterium]
MDDMFAIGMALLMLIALFSGLAVLTIAACKLGFDLLILKLRRKDKKKQAGVATQQQ